MVLLLVTAVLSPEKDTFVEAATTIPEDLQIEVMKLLQPVMCSDDSDIQEIVLRSMNLKSREYQLFLYLHFAFKIVKHNTFS